MALLQDLIAQIADPVLRERILLETNKLLKQKKFGLVFEEHLPECTPLYEVPVRVGSTVALKTGTISDLYTVLNLDGREALCERRETRERQAFLVDDLVVAASFGEPIYPYLKQVDTVCNDPDSNLWHTLIEADNYHALQLLEYLYAGKVDCIYIDPPYNTGARDWKYNNDYVDSRDAYRHSKWLSMMEKRLKIAKKLLNPKDSVLIVTIDEKEYIHLGCLMEEIFSNAHQQMVSIVINPNGVARDHEMYRVEEYAFFVYFGSAGPAPLEDSMFSSDARLRKKNSLGEDDDDFISHSQRTKVRWEWLMRGGSNSERSHSPGCFYPVFIDPKKKKIVDVGEALPLDGKIESVPDRNGLVTVWPIARGTRHDKVWRMSASNLKNLIDMGFAKVGAYDKIRDRWSLLYLGRNQRERIERGEIVILARDENGVAIVEEAEERIPLITPKTIWNRQAHNAGEYGSRLIRAIIPGHNFSFPKSIYAVRDTLKAIVVNKPHALIVDFFAGSGTTLHAVNLLNAGDGGSRRCILVTNNEVSDDEAKALKKQGYKPGDEEWEQLGIARYVTWPRTVCSIKGQDVNGAPLKGNYLGSDMPMAKGFKANAIYFKLGFLDKTLVALDTQFKELLSVLWMKAGAIGPCPALTTDELPNMLVLPENRFAVLLEEAFWPEFSTRLTAHPEIQTVFLVTDSDATYKEMTRELEEKVTYQLYKDYLENFRINRGR